jgi:hypothetical protein
LVWRRNLTKPRKLFQLRLVLIAVLALAPANVNGQSDQPVPTPANAGLTNERDYIFAYARQRNWFHGWEKARELCKQEEFRRLRELMRRELVQREREYNQINRLGVAAEQKILDYRLDLYHSAKHFVAIMNAAPVPSGRACEPRANSAITASGEVPAQPTPVVGEHPVVGGGKIAMVNLMTGSFETGWGEMRLIGGSGRYDHNDGRLEVEKIESAVAEGKWTQSESDRQCPDGRYWGRFRFTFSETGFTGVWSYCDETLGGNWNGTRK